MTSINVTHGGAGNQTTGCAAPPTSGDVHHSLPLVHGVMRNGQAVRIGRVEVEAGEISVLVSIGKTPVVALARDGDAWTFCARPFGPAHPELIDVSKPAPLETCPSAGAAAPLVRVGPGGSYVRNIHEEDLRL